MSAPPPPELMPGLCLRVFQLACHPKLYLLLTPRQPAITKCASFSPLVSCHDKMYLFLTPCSCAIVKCVFFSACVQFECLSHVVSGRYVRFPGDPCVRSAGGGRGSSKSQSIHSKKVIRNLLLSANTDAVSSPDLPCLEKKREREVFLLVFVCRQVKFSLGVWHHGLTILH